MMDIKDILYTFEAMDRNTLEYLQRLLIVKYIPLAQEREYNQLRGGNVVRDETVRIDEQDSERDQ